MPQLLLVGPPNAGKSTLFNRLTGGNARTGNYLGTTVGVERGSWDAGGVAAELVDLPGTASLVAQAADEEVTLRALLNLAETGSGAVLLVLDGPRLARSLYLALQVLELRVPVVVAVNLADEAREAGRPADLGALEALLGVPCVGVSGRTGEGMEAFASAVAGVLREPGRAVSAVQTGWPEALEADVRAVVEALGDDAPPEAQRAGLARWALQSPDRVEAGGRHGLAGVVRERRAAASAAGRDVDGEIAAARYAWIDAAMPSVVRAGSGAEDHSARRSDAIDRVLLNPLSGTLVLLGIVWFVFVALFSWSDSLMGGIESVFAQLGDAVGRAADAVAGGTPGPVLEVARDAVVDGLIAGVGGVLVFLPQIAVLFFLLAVLEDVGYLARASALVDRVLRAAGLPARAFVPLVSGYACAVPAILATRSLPRWRDRLLVMAVIPLTTCSARLPVYALVIACVFPETLPGWPLPVRPTVMLAMYAFSTVLAVLAAVVIGRLVLPQAAEPAVLELPPYRMPSWGAVGRNVVGRCRDFLREAGGLILVATMVLWALLAFPRYAPEDVLTGEEIAAATASGVDLEELAAPRVVERSYGGRLGHWVEPAIAPLGFDWKIGVGLLGAFAAREVFVSTLGVVYGIADADETSEGLRARVQADVHPDGSPVWTLPTGLAVLVFFAIAMQCTSTLAVLRNESGGWRWPAFVAAYMTVLAYVSAAAVRAGAIALGL